MKLKLEGIIPAVHTPMMADGTLNLDAIEPQVTHLLASGANGVFVCGTTGESASLALAERRRVAEAYVQTVAGRVPVIVHVGHNALPDARGLAAHAAEIGADAIAAVPPSYYPPTDVESLVASCAEITAGAPELPFFYYHIPSMTGVNVSMTAFLRAAQTQLPSLVGVKYTDNTMDQFIDCLASFDGKYQMMFGRDEMMLSALATGTRGFVGSTYNYATPLYQKLWNAFEAGDLQTARLWQYRAVQFINVQIAFGGTRASKEFMKLIGVDCGPVRSPMKPFTPEESAALRQALTAIGFFDWRTGA